MATIGGATLTLELDDASGSGTWPTDISTRLDLRQGVTVQRGRTTAFEDVQASQLTCRLKNNDGALSRGGALGTFRDQRIRLSTTHNGTTWRRFTGYARGWPNAWEGGPGKKSFVDMVALDQLPRWSRQQMGNQIKQEFLALSPVAYYPLDEPAGSAGASNVAPTKAPTLTGADYGPPTFGVTMAGLGVDTAAQQSAQFVYHYALAAGSATPLIGSATGFTLLMAYAGTTAGVPIAELGDKFNSVGFTLSIDSSGYLTATRTTSSGSSLVNYLTTPVNDGAVHLVGLAYDGSSLTVIVDTSTITVAAVGSLGTTSYLILGGQAFAANFTGQLAHAALFGSVLTFAQIQTLRQAVLTGFAGEASDARVRRLLRYAGVPTTSTEAGALTATPPQVTNGQFVLPALQQVVKAEGGLLFVRGDGVPVMQNRYHRANRTSPAVVLADGDISPDTVILDDPDQTQNYVTGSRMPTGTTTDTPTLNSQDAASIAKHGQYPNSDLTDLLVMTDAQVQDAIDWRRSGYAEPPPRIASLKVDALTLETSRATTLRTALLGMEISDRIQLPTLPSQAASVGDLIAEGWTETYKLSGSDAEWSYDINASSWPVEQMWILDSPSYSQLDMTTRLGY